MDRWVDVWVDGYMDGWTVVGWVDGRWMDGWVVDGGWMDGWMVDGGWMDLKNPTPNESSSIILSPFPLPFTAETPAISIQQLNEMPRQG